MKLAIPGFLVGSVQPAEDEKSASAAGRRDVDADKYEMTKYGRRPVKAKRGKIATIAVAAVAAAGWLIWLIV